MKKTQLLLLLFIPLEGLGSDITDQEAEKLLTLGQKYFSVQQYSNALVVWNKLISTSAHRKEKVIQLQSIAESNIGYIYSNGLGVKVDYSKAEEYWLESSKKGNMEAKYHLCYTYGGKKIPGKGIIEASQFCKSAYNFYRSKTNKEYSDKYIIDHISKFYREYKMGEKGLERVNDK